MNKNHKLHKNQSISYIILNFSNESISKCNVIINGENELFKWM